MNHHGGSGGYRPPTFPNARRSYCLDCAQSLSLLFSRGARPRWEWVSKKRKGSVPPFPPSHFPRGHASRSPHSPNYWLWRQKTGTACDIILLKIADTNVHFDHKPRRFWKANSHPNTKPHYFSSPAPLFRKKKRFIISPGAYFQNFTGYTAVYPHWRIVKKYF